MSDKTVNTMVELTKTNKITFAVLAMLLVVVLGFLFLKPTKYVFNTSLAKDLADIKTADFQVSPQELAKSLIQKDQNLVLVDVRNQFDFAKGHLPEAKNIYSVNLMEDPTIDFFMGLKKANKKAVLYGNSAAEANVPFMILKQMGIENISYLNAGYDVIKNLNWEMLTSDVQNYNDENPVADFAQFIENANKKKSEGANTELTKQKVDSKPKPKVLIKPKEKVAEDEGC